MCSIVAYLAMGAADVIGAVEPFLVRNRLAVVTRIGRQLTDLGMKYLQDECPKIGVGQEAI